MYSTCMMTQYFVLTSKMNLVDRPILQDSDNWNTVDIDKPYAKCDICERTIESNNELNLCHVCSFHSTLSP